MVRAVRAGCQPGFPAAPALAPPARAAVFCVDEKPQIQALERTAPVPPMIPGNPERRSFDCTRHGTVDLFAALNTAIGKVIGKLLTHLRGWLAIMWLSSHGQGLAAMWMRAGGYSS
jgi:hypothetical protein